MFPGIVTELGRVTALGLERVRPRRSLPGVPQRAFTAVTCMCLTVVQNATHDPTICRNAWNA